MLTQQTLRKIEDELETDGKKMKLKEIYKWFGKTERME
jgi:hypothetical protein